MCGIVGISLRSGVSRNHSRKDLRSVFTKMLIAAQTRGRSATGVALITEADGKPKAHVIRSPLCAADFVESKEYKELIEKLDDKAFSIIGHTRAVTGGAVARDNRNNHPHITGSVIGVHNGVINNDTSLWAKYSGYMQPRSRCDSEVVFSLINRKLTTERDTDTAIYKAVEEISGWYALALVNVAEPHKVFLVRDDHTPMKVYWWAYGEAAFFASDGSHIEAPFKDVRMSGSLREHSIDKDSIVGLDSTVKGNAQDFFVHSKKTSGISAAARAKLITENKEAYEISQGLRAEK